MSCDLFNGVGDICEEVTQELAIDISSPPTISPTATATYSSTFASGLSAAYTGFAYDGDLITNPLIISQTTSEEVTFVYTINYLGVETNRGYEGILNLIAETITATPPEDLITVHVDVFGTVVISETVDFGAINSFLWEF